MRGSASHDRESDEDSAANMYMASPPSPPAVRSIGKLTHTIALSFKNDAVDISLRLLSRRLISEEAQERILLTSYTPTEKAAILVVAVKNTIKRDPEKFDDLLNVLSEHNDTISVEKVLRSTYQEIVKESQTAQNSSSEESCAEPTPKRPKLNEPRGRIQSFLSDEPDVCEAAEVPYRRSSLKISNPVIENFSELGDDDKENITDQIQSLAEIIQEEFLKLGELVLQSLKARKIEPKSLVNTLTQCEVYSTEKEHKVKLFQLHSRDLSEANDIYNIFSIISPYYSWFNYELFMKIVNTHGSDEDKKNMEHYCQDFSEYCQRIPCVEFQENHSKSSHQIKIKFKLDLDIKSLNVYEIKHIQRNIARILKLQSSVLVLSSIENGCMALVFLAPSHIAAQLVELAVDEKAKLCQEIKMISIDQEQDNPYQKGENGHDHQDYFESAKRGDLKRIQTLIEGGIEIDTVDEKNHTALLHASHEGHIDVARFLLKKGANSNWQADDGWTALMLASYRGHVEIVELLLLYDSDVNLTTQHGWTALQRLCLYNQQRYPDAKYEASERRAEVAKLLVDHGTDIRKVDKQGRTALIAASDSGFADIVKLLVHKASQFPNKERQKYLDHKKHFSWTALMSASEKGYADVIRILIEAGVSRSITKDKDEVTALHIAVHNGHVEAVEVLTHKMNKEDINARDNYGMTPLILATQRNSEQLINVLIHAGADVDAKNEDQMTALMFAVKVGSLDVVKLLAEKSTELFAMNSRDEILFEMAKNSTEEIEQYLLEKYKIYVESVRKGCGGGGSAHGSSRAASAANTTSDNPPTLSTMLRILLPVSSQWMNIGVMLSLSHRHLTAIETRCRGVPDNCLREMLNEWLQQDNPRPTKSALVDAVEMYSPSLAEKISAL